MLRPGLAGQRPPALVHCYRRLRPDSCRFRIACLLSRGEFCVNEITEIVSEGKTSNISQQLKMLALSGVIDRRRENQRILYRLKDRRVGKMIQFLQEQFLNGEMK